MAPGDCTGDKTLTLKNNGTVDANHVDITPITNSDSTIAPYLRINNLTYGGSPVTVTNSNGTSFADLADLAAGTALVNINGISAGSTKDLVMDVCLDVTAPNAVQGLSDTLALTVGLKQGPHPAGD